VSSLLPPFVFHGENIIANENNLNSISILLQLASVSSFCIDYILRNKVSATINMFPVLQLPLLELKYFFKCQNQNIVRVLRLTCDTKLYFELWEDLYEDIFTESEFWYPNSYPIDNYGPKHEQDIRKRIRDQAATLTSEWTPECGVHERLPDRRDTGDRAQLRAEIDAYVAHLYRISRDDFAYILDTFPVLKRKEEAAFGEFMSKRKCLEEYDRIKIILAESIQK
jgi:hypothetical protein